MKTLFFALFAITTLAATAQKWETVKGNGNVKTESRTVGSFTAVDSRGSMNVDISYGQGNTVSVEADENLLPYIVTKVEGDKLLITTSDKAGISSKNKLVVHVTMAKVTGLAVSGSGNITGSGQFSNDNTTKLSVSGSGNMKLGFASFSAIDASVNGSGNMELTDGKTTSINASVSGSGNITAYAVESKTVKARVSGSGNVKVTASESLEAVSSGSGNVYYKGTATVVKAQSHGSGKVIKG